MAKGGKGTKGTKGGKSGKGGKQFSRKIFYLFVVGSFCLGGLPTTSLKESYNG